MSVPRVLLLTGTPPSTTGIGGIFLRDLCLAYPKGSLCCFSVVEPGFDYGDTTLDGVPTATVCRPGMISPPDSAPARVGAALARYCRDMLRARPVARQAAEFGREHKVQVVWATLGFSFMAQIARRVASHLQVPLITHVWDPPELLALQEGLDRLSRDRFLKEFAKAQRTAIRCGVASDAMKRDYESRFGVPSVTLIHGLPQSLRRTPACATNHGSQFVIGFAGGNMYTPEEWKALLRSLDALEWRVAGRDVVVRLLTGSICLWERGRQRIEWLGYHPIADAIRLLAEVDVLYLPYWFDPQYATGVRLCFPNKLATYLAAGRPVLYHGPTDSTPTEFFRRYPVGHCCHSLEPADIAQSLQRFATDTEFYARSAEATAVAYECELSQHVFLQRFAALMGVEESTFASPVGSGTQASPVCGLGRS